jgi:hypothetical protein
MSVLDLTAILALIGLVVVRVALPVFGVCLFCSVMKHMFPNQV